MSDESKTTEAREPVSVVTGDSQAVIDAATRAAGPTQVAEQKAISVQIPAGGRHELIDLERFESFPRRKRGIHKVATVESFIGLAKTLDESTTSDEGEEENLAATTVWVHPTAGKVVAVLNDHDYLGGWGDHRVDLTLIVPDEWKHWARRDGELGGQVDFAEHVEDGLTEIVEPAAADLLEIAQSFHATTQANFESGQRLADGQVSLRYQENIEAKAGQNQQLEIPATFTLAIAPFIGEDPVELTARLRYRVSGGNLKIGYKLDRPDEVVRAALDRIATTLRGEFDRVYLGEPREARS